MFNFKNLTIAKKLAIGFGSILVLLVVLALIAYNALDTALDGFSEYRTTARDTNRSVKGQTKMLETRIAVKDFLGMESDEALRLQAKRWAETQEVIAVMKKELEDKDRLAMVAEVEENAAKYEKAFARVKELMNQRNALAYETLVPIGQKMEASLGELMENAREDNDMTVAYYSGLAMRHILMSRIHAGRYLDKNDPSAISRLRSEMTSYNDALTRLSREVNNANRARKANHLKELGTQY